MERIRAVLAMPIGEALQVAKLRFLRLFERKAPEVVPGLSKGGGVRHASLQQQAALQQAALAQMQAMQNRGLGQASVSYGQMHAQRDMTQVHTVWLHSGYAHPNLPPRWRR